MSQQRGRGGSHRRAAPHAGSAGAGAAPHSAAAGASPSAAACGGDTWVRCQPCVPVLWPQGHNAPNLTCCCPPAESAARPGAAGRSPGTRRAPPPASVASHASGPALLQPPVPGSRQPAVPPAAVPALGTESTPVSPPPQSGSALWDSARPYLGRAAPAGAAGSGFPRPEPGSPCSAAAPAPVCGHRHRWAVLWGWPVLSTG